MWDKGKTDHKQASDPCSPEGWKGRNGRTHGWNRWKDGFGRTGVYDQKGKFQHLRPLMRTQLHEEERPRVVKARLLKERWKVKTIVRPGCLKLYL